MKGKSADSYFDLIFYFFHGDSAIVDSRYAIEWLSSIAKFAIGDSYSIAYRKKSDEYIENYRYRLSPR